MAEQTNTTTAEAAQTNAAARVPHEQAALDPAARPGAPAAVQRAAQQVAHGSPQTPPARFGALLTHQQSAPAVRAGVLRQLQHSYGNNYVGEVIQCSVENAAAGQLPDLPPDPPRDDDRNFAHKLRRHSSDGHALEGGTQARLEQALGADLAHVRLHDDGAADELARAVNARAFTTGRDIYFRQGAYQPNQQDGLRLLAHEVSHVVQQAQGPVAGTAEGGVNLSHPADAFERGARSFAEGFVAGTNAPAGAAGARLAPVAHAPAAAPSVQRDEAATGSVDSKTATSTNAGQGGAGGAPPQAEPEAQTQNASTVTIGQTIEVGGMFFSTDAEQMNQLVQFTAKQGGVEGAERLLYLLDQEYRSWSPEKLRDQAAVKLLNDISQVVYQAVEALKQYRDQLVKTYAESAATFTNSLLDKSVEIINKEVEHYGLKPKVEDPSYKEGPDITGTNLDPGDPYAPDITNADAGKSVVAAAKELLGLKVELRRLSVEISGLTPRMRGQVITEEQENERAALDKQRQEVQRRYDLARAKHEAEHPILAAYQDDTSGLSAIASGASEAAASIAPLIGEKLRNIDEVRAGVGKLIWKEERIIKGTKAVLGVQPKTVDDALINEYASDIKWSHTLQNLALGVIAIALGLVAALPTGGASLGIAIASTAAAVGGAALSVYQAGKAVEEYELEAAAAGTDFDKAKAISGDDPSLFWLALDIVAAIVDVRGALHAFKGLSGAVRAAIASRALVKEGEAAAKAAGVGAKELEAIKSLTGSNTQLYESILKHIGEAADAGKAPLAELEEAARAQYKALKDSGRLAEVGDISEELFVKQMTSGARSHIIISGAEGIKRTRIVTQLLDPANPVLGRVLRGDTAAMDGLLIEHGNWKQLLSMLDQGTPEMRRAAAALVARRAEIELEVEFLYNARLSGKRSSELVSDIDRATEGVDAGSEMIKAEEWVAAQYGKGWSEVLRMNIYTEAARLSQYEKVMGGLSHAQRGELLARITEETEIYNIAKMMEHARGNEELLKEVKTYAERLHIKLDDARIQEVLPQLSGGMTVTERNKLLLDADELMKRYSSARPGSPEQLQLAEEITRKQMRANLFTEEAYVGPGAGRMTIGRHAVVGHEAYQAALSNVEMIYHTLGQNGGDIVLTMRQYEIYKYMNRFAEAAEFAGVKHPMLKYWKTVSHAVYRTERKGLEEVSYLRPHRRMSVIDPDITDVEAKQLYDSWRGFSQKVLDDMKKAAEQKPQDWTPTQ